MSTVIEPKQTTYNSRYMQNIEIDKLSSSMAQISPNNRELSKVYLSKFINSNLLAFCPGLTRKSILYGLDCYVIDINQNKISILVTSGATIVDSTLLLLNAPQILTIDTTGISNIDKLVVVLDFKYDISQQVGNSSIIFNRTPTRTVLKPNPEPNTGMKPKYVQATSANIPFSLKVFFIDNDTNPINANGLTWNASTYEFLAIYKLRFLNDSLYKIDQYNHVFNRINILTKLINDYNIKNPETNLKYIINKPVLLEKLTNNGDIELLSISISGITYTVPRFSFIPNDIKNKLINSFKLQISGRHTIPDLPFYTRRFERFARVSQIYHEHNN